MKLTSNLLTIALSITLSSAASAAFTIDLTGNNDYDGENPLLIPFIDGANSATATLVPTGGSFNSNAGDFGINDGTEASETSDQIDGTDEIVTITFNKDILFNFIDLGGVGPDADDGVSFTIAGSTTILETDVTGFNGTTDVYTPTSPISLLTGQSIILTGESTNSSFDIQSLNVTVVPEPGTFALLSGFCGLVFVMLKRRRG